MRRPKQGVRAAVATKGPLAVLSSDLKPDVTDQGSSQKTAQEDAEQVDVVLIAVDDIHTMPTSPAGDPPGVPKGKEGPFSVRQWHRVDQERNPVPFQPFGELTHRLDDNKPLNLLHLTEQQPCLENSRSATKVWVVGEEQDPHEYLALDLKNNRVAHFRYGD